MWDHLGKREKIRLEVDKAHLSTFWSYSQIFDQMVCYLFGPLDLVYETSSNKIGTEFQLFHLYLKACYKNKSVLSNWKSPSDNVSRLSCRRTNVHGLCKPLVRVNSILLLDVAVHEYLIPLQDTIANFRMFQRH